VHPPGAAWNSFLPLFPPAMPHDPRCGGCRCTASPCASNHPCNAPYETSDANPARVPFRWSGSACLGIHRIQWMHCTVWGPEKRRQNRTNASVSRSAPKPKSLLRHKKEQWRCSTSKASVCSCTAYYSSWDSLSQLALSCWTARGDGRPKKKPIARFWRHCLFRRRRSTPQRPFFVDSLMPEATQRNRSF